MENIGTIRLETKRLNLRLLTPEDAQQMFDYWANDAKVTKYLNWKPYQTVKDVRNNLSEYQKNYIDVDYFFWGIEVKASQQLIGTISASIADKTAKVAEIGYCIGQNWWCKGYTSEALEEVIAYLFDQNDFKRIEAIHDADNMPSGKVMEKAGMRYEGTLRQRLVNNRGLVDGVYYAILKKDYISQKAQHQIYNFLNEVDISYQLLTHKAVYTINEIDFDIPGTRVKNLFLQGKNGFYLVILAEDKRAILKTIAQEVDERHLSFASEQKLSQILHTTQGAVSPLGLLFDKEQKVQLIIDEQVPVRGEISFHPNRNDKTLIFDFKDFLTFLTKINHPPKYISN